MPKKKGHPELSRLAGEQNWALGRLLAKAATTKAWQAELDRMAVSCKFPHTKHGVAAVNKQLEELKQSLYQLHFALEDDFAQQRKQLRVDLESKALSNRAEEDGNNS